jgi:hypothetical protein
MRRALALGWKGLSSLGLSCVLLVLLGLLTWLGTLEQTRTGLYEVQRKYFESFVLFHDAGGVSVPLPGANLVMSVLFANLLAGGIARLRRDASTAGVLVAHLGIVLLLVSSFLKLHHSTEGHVTLYEGQSAAHFQSYYRWELAVLEATPEGALVERVVPHARFESASGDSTVDIAGAGLPFRLVVHHFLANCSPLPKGPMFEVDLPVVDGVFLRERPRDATAERNIAGVYVELIERAGRVHKGLLWGAQAAPWTVEVDGRRFAIDLRKERYPLGFTLALEDFRKEDHPRLNMPRAFESDVEVVEAAAKRKVTISMNEPLRTGGLVLYQASWGPASARPGDPLFSTFAVVRNPADQLPLISCLVISLGLIWHFGRMLVRHVRREVRTT